MEVQGTVLSWRNGEARVTVAAGACSECTSHCPARSMARPGLLIANAPEPLVPGQTVRLEVALPSPAKAATLTFGLPLLGFMAGLFGANAVFAGAPLPTLAAGLGGTGLMYAIVALAERKRRSTILTPCHTIR